MEKSDRPQKRRMIRIRHKHDEAQIPGLRGRMISEGIDGLEIEKVFKDILKKDFKKQLN